jgi:hypothetical protein
LAQLEKDGHLYKGLDLSKLSAGRKADLELDLIIDASGSLTPLDAVLQEITKPAPAIKREMPDSLAGLPLGIPRAQRGGKNKR